MNASRIASIGFLIFTLFPGNLTVSAQTIQVSKDNRTIAITTTDEAQAVADRAVVSIGYTVYGTDQDGTYAEASKGLERGVQGIEGRRREGPGDRKPRPKPYPD